MLKDKLTQDLLNGAIDLPELKTKEQKFDLQESDDSHKIKLDLWAAADNHQETADHHDREYRKARDAGDTKAAELHKKLRSLHKDSEHASRDLGDHYHVKAGGKIGKV